MLTLQVCAIAFGALVDAFLGMDKAWTDNAFYYSMRETWPVGPILLAAVFCFVFVVRRRLGSRHQPAGDPADAAAQERLGTVSSHSVP